MVNFLPLSNPSPPTRFDCIPYACPQYRKFQNLSTEVISHLPMSLKRPILPMTQIYRLIPSSSIYRSWPMSGPAIGSWVPPARVLIGMIFSSVCKTAMPALMPQKGSSVGLCLLSVWRNFPIYARHSEESPYCWRMMC